LLQLHCIPKQYLQEGDIFDWLRELKQEGLIKHFGASVETVEEGLICMEQDELLSLQVIFNMFKQTTFQEDDHRNYNKNGEAFNVGETFAGLPFEKGIDIVKTIKDDILPDNLTMVQLALRWILDYKAVSTIIPGASSPNQVTGNAHASVIESLSKETNQALTQLYKTEIHNQIRGAY